MTNQERLQECKQKYEGQVKLNKFGTPMKLLEYINSDNVIVEFQDEYKAKVKVQYGSFKNGKTRNPYDKEVLGIACIGETKCGDGNGKHKKSYRHWFNMLNRCYGDESKLNRKYKRCTVCKEWLCYANFEKWFDENYYECPIGGKMCLDKDILIKGNKTYSPNTCCFVPNRINVMFTKRDNKRGSSVIGSTFYEGRYYVRVSDGTTKGSIKLGSYDNEDEAFEVYKQAKEKLIQSVAEEYKQYIPSNVYKALHSYRVERDD
jgi:hypothetical protein